MRPRPILCYPALTVALGACAPVTPKIYVAPTRETVTSSLEDVSAGGPGHVIYVANGSSVPIQVSSVTLYDCENIKLRCDEPIRLKQRLEPGRRHSVARIDPKDSERSYHFRYRFSWEEIRGQTGPQQVQKLLDSALLAGPPPAGAIPFPEPPVAPAQPESVTGTPEPAYLPTPVRGRTLTVGYDSLAIIVGERVSFPSLPQPPSSGAETPVPLVTVVDSDIARVTGAREILGLAPGRTELILRVAGAVTRIPLIVSAPPARPRAPARLTVLPQSLTLAVGQRYDLSRLRVWIAEPAGDLTQAAGWSLLVEDEAVVQLDAGVLVARRQGATAIVLEVRGVRARVPVAVIPR
jgi:hypothetical protein